MKKGKVELFAHVLSEVLEVLTVVLVVLKLVGVVSISWFLCFLPLMIKLGIFVLCCFLIGFIDVIIKSKRR